MWQATQAAPRAPAGWCVCAGVANVAGSVAVRAQRVAGRAAAWRLCGLVAVRAGDALGVHPALQERAVLVDLVLDLAVRVVEARSRSAGRWLSSSGTPAARPPDTRAARAWHRAQVSTSLRAAGRCAAPPMPVAASTTQVPRPRVDEADARPSSDRAGALIRAAPRRRGWSPARGMPRSRR